MTLFNTLVALRRWMEQHPFFGGGASIMLFLAAFLVRYALNDVLPPGFPYLTFFPAIVIATFLFGTAAGILCAVLSFVAAWYFFLPPFLTFSLSGSTGLALGFFVLIVMVDIFIIDRMLDAMIALEAARREAIVVAEQRDNLFRELQHRVGNNLNMISALLNIQSRGIDDAGARHALGEASRRIGLVADINRMFHDPSHSDGVLDEAFVRELVSKCLDATGMSETVSATTDIRAVALAQEVFLPVALVLAECINNALEHGTDEGGKGHLRITLRHSEADAILRIENTGRPLAPDFDARRTNSIGLLLVQSFARQINGTFTLTGGTTTLCELRFPLPVHAPGPDDADDAGLRGAPLRPAALT